MQKNIFRAYDVRGIYPEEIDGEIAYKIAVAYGNLIGRGEVIVGRDVRLGSGVIAHATISGLLASGNDVIDVGIVPTPTVYFGATIMKCKGGIVVTASHNPPEYVGLKFTGEGGVSLTYETGINKIEELVIRNEYKVSREVGQYLLKDIIEEYWRDIKEKIGKIEGECVIENGNGTGGRILSKFQEIGLKIKILNEKPDGRFPAGVVNPVDESTLQNLRRHQNGRIGIAFDVDADRVGFVDEEGELIPGDVILAIYALDILEKRGKVKVIMDILASKKIVEYLQNKGCSVILSKIGHSYVMRKILEENADLGGETSGHYYFRDEHYGFDDGIYSALRLLKILYRKGIKLHDLTKNFPKRFITPRIRVRVGDTSKFEIVEILRRETRNLSADRIITIDGVRVEYEKGWYLIRASNTQPDIVLRVEGDDREMLQKLYKEAVNLLERAAEKLNIKLDIKSVG